MPYVRQADLSKVPDELDEELGVRERGSKESVRQTVERVGALSSDAPCT